MTCVYLHSCLLDLLNLSILSLVSAITLISPIITRMLGSNGELSNRQQCFPNRIISFRKVLDGRYYCWASGGLWLQHWTALGSTWAGTACVYSLIFLLFCVSIHVSISGNSINSVFDNPFYEGLFHELSIPLGMGGNVSELAILLQSDHLTYTSSTK